MSRDCRSPPSFSRLLAPSSPSPPPPSRIVRLPFPPFPEESSPPPPPSPHPLLLSAQFASPSPRTPALRPRPDLTAVAPPRPPAAVSSSASAASQAGTPRDARCASTPRTTSRAAIPRVNVAPSVLPPSLTPSSTVALTSSRSSLIGIASLSCARPELVLTQLEDSASFHLTLSALQQFDPHTIIFPISLAETPLIGIVRYSVRARQEEEEESSGQRATALRLVQVQSHWFDESVGRQRIADVCSPGSVSRVALDSAHFLCVSAAAALLAWQQDQQEERFEPQALRLSYRTITELMKIDTQTAAALELISSKQLSAARSSSVPKPCPPAFPSAAARRRPPRTVFDSLNHTRTVSGARLLRLSLLQPFRDPASITARLDALQELMRLQASDSSPLSRLPALLSRFSQLDSVLMQALVRPPAQADQLKYHTILHLLELSRCMVAAQAVAAALAGCQSSLLAKARAQLGDDMSNDIIGIIAAEIDEERCNDRGDDLLSQRNRIAYAVRAGADDYLRTNQCCYSDTLVDIDAEVSRVNGILAQAAAQQTAADSGTGSSPRGAAGGAWRPRRPAEAKGEAKLIFTQARGFHLHVSPSALQQQQALCSSLAASSGSRGCSLDSRSDCVHFTQPVKKSRTAATTTSVMLTLQQRQQGLHTKILQCSARRISSLTATLRELLPFLLACSDEVAVLDLLQSFATTISTASIRYCRPRLSLSGPISLRGCYHPLLLSLLPHGACVPNGVELSQDSNLCVLTGVNGGGKSSYLRMIGVALVMTGIGMFLPCEQADVRLCDELFLRGTSGEGGSAGGGGGAGTEEGETSSSSALYREMREVTHILRQIRGRCVVLLDEIGRSTSSQSGLALAWTVAEQLAAHRHTYTVLATHFTRLADLDLVYSNIINTHTTVRLLPPAASAAASASASSASSSRLQYLHQVRDGAFLTCSDYGIDVAEKCRMDAAVIAAAHALQAQLQQSRRDQALAAERRVARRGQGVTSNEAAVQELLSLKGTSMRPADIRAELLRIRDRYCSGRDGAGAGRTEQKQEEEMKQEEEEEVESVVLD